MSVLFNDNSINDTNRQIVRPFTGIREYPKLDRRRGQLTPM